MSRENAGYN